MPESRRQTTAKIPNCNCESCENTANAAACELAGEYVDAGVSGSKDSRPELNRLMAEEKKYLAACTEPLRSIATILVDTGLRPEECFRLKWECITFNKDGGRIFNEFGKSNAARRHVSMTKRVRAILFQRWTAAGKPQDGWVFAAQKASAGHVVPNTVYEPHLEAIKASGVRPFVLYSLRHTALTRLGQGGCSPWTLAQIAGWSNINQSKTYVHPDNDEAAAAIARLDSVSSETNQKQTRSRRIRVRTRKVGVSRTSTAS